MARCKTRFVRIRISCLVALSAASCDRCVEPVPLSSDAAYDAPPVDAEVRDALVDASVADVAADAKGDAERAASCPLGMALVTLAEPARESAYCIDRYEAYVVVVEPDGRERPHSPYSVVEGATFRAKVAANVVPQAYVSQVAAARACKNASKRLCKKEEFERACRGPDDANLYPYGGAERIKGYCNEGKGSSIPAKYGTDPAKWTFKDFNDPELNQWRGKLAKTGEHARCVSPYGVFDLVGNLHEWGDDAPDGKGRARFRGGWYGDAEVNGHGCAYVTKAHEPTYHDYSTGFRCCKDALYVDAPLGDEAGKAQNRAPNE